ncbi:MAG: tyrosine-type recombinase/integrase [Candidatus Methanoperedens sp.]|nr:tyrosine-type recombinase/integrase [Candidatus Methanoperedens sp.]
MDFLGKEGRYRLLKVRIEVMEIPEANKKAVIEFVESCMVGMYGTKIGKVRAERVLLSLKNLCKLLPEGKVLHEVTKLDIKSLLLKIDEHPGWGDWEKYVTLSVLRKFMTWLRTEYGYPEGYPDREKLLNMLPLMKFAPEAKYNISKPNKLKNINEIPTAQEIQWMLEACDTFKDKVEGTRDKAIIAVLEEIGARIGGIGMRRIADVTFDALGALITIQDKTMQGEPVRLIKSVPYLRNWLEVHPLKNNPEAPLWVNLGSSHKKIEMDYSGTNKALKKTVKIHNMLAESKGLPKITRRIHFHAFRYYAQTRDMLEGMPISIMCRQRGWSPTSKQPMRYARVSSQQADDWLAAHYGLTEKISEIAGKEPSNKDIRDRQPVQKREDLPGYL